MNKISIFAQDVKASKILYSLGYNCVGEGFLCNGVKVYEFNTTEDVGHVELKKHFRGGGVTGIPGSFYVVFTITHTL
jgi:hypothetical protein